MKWTLTLVMGLSLCVAACDGTVEVKPSSETTCDGALGMEPRVLAEGLGEGQLFAAGDHLLHVATETGRVLRIDGCSGRTELLAELGAAQRAAFHEGSVYVVVSSQGSPQLWRVPVAGGAPEVVAELASSASIVAHRSGVFLMMKAADSEDRQLFSLDEASGKLSLVGEVDVWAPGTSVSLIGVSDAGLYVRENYDCGCNPELSLVPFDGTDIRGVPNTAGALSLAVVGSSLFVATDLDAMGFGEVLLDIVRLPLEGGTPDILLGKDMDHTSDVRRIAANEKAVCWASYAAAPRCLRLAAGSAARALEGEDDHAGVTPLVMTHDAVYWLRAAAGGSSFDLVGAVP